jgi:hypothetical protein
MVASIFFSGKREHFFRPLTWQDRECYSAVVRTIYDRINGPNADYAEVLTKDLVLSLITSVIIQPPLRQLVFEPGRVLSAEEERAAASKMLLALRENGWLEDNRDLIDLKPTLKLTRAGKEFAEVFSNLDNNRLKTRQRNMRSCKKSLNAFLDGHEVDELLDAYEFATRVVQDLQDDIEYFRTLIQSLTREALAQRVAWEDFNEFVDTRFAKEYAVRLVADSADRHRGQILETLELVRAMEGSQRQPNDLALLERASWLVAETHGRSPSIWLCDRIEGMVDAACGHKLPMLRSEMNNYIKRFTSLLRQALSLDYSAESALGRSMSWLKEKTGAERMLLLDVLATRLSPCEVRLVPGSIRWTVKEKTEAQAIQAPLVVNEESRVLAAMKRAEAQAFAISEQEILAAIFKAIPTSAEIFKLSELPAESALHVLVGLHAVGAARSMEGRKQLKVKRLEGSYETDFFSADNYALERKDKVL